MSEQLVHAYAEGIQSGCPFIVEEKAGRVPCSVARVLVHPVNSRFPVRLLNPKNEPVELAADLTIGTIEKIEEQSSLSAVANASALPLEHSNTSMDEFLWCIVEENSSGLSKEDREIILYS